MPRLTLALLLTSVGCSSGMSAPPPPVCVDDRVLYTGNVWGGNVAVDDGRVYYTTFGEGVDADEHAVWSVAECGGTPSLVWRGGPDEIFGFGMAVHDGTVFWSEIGDDGINGVFSAPAAGGPRTQLGEFHSAEAAYAGVAADDTNVYAGSYDEIVSVPIAGGPTTTLYSGYVYWGAVLSDGALYFTADDSLWRIALPDGTPQRVALVLGMADGQFDIHEGAAYIAATDDVMRVPLDGSPQTEVLDGLAEPSQVVVSADAIYTQVATAMGYGIVRIPLTGGTPVLIHDGIRSGTSHLVLDGDALYVVYCCNDPGAISGGDVLRIAL